MDLCKTDSGDRRVKLTTETRALQDRVISASRAVLQPTVLQTVPVNNHYQPQDLTDQAPPFRDTLNWGEGPVIVTSNYSFGKRYIKFTERWMESLKVAIYTDKNKEQRVSRFYQYDFSEIKWLPCQKVSYYLDKGLIFLKTFLPTRILSGMRLRQYYQIRFKLWDTETCV